MSHENCIQGEMLFYNNLQNTYFFLSHIFVKHWTSVPVCAFFFMSFVNTRLSDHTWSSCLNSERVRWPLFAEFQRYQHISSSKKSQQPSASNVGGISNILQHNHRNLAHKIKAVPITRTFNKAYIKIRQSPTILPANGEEVRAQGEWRAMKAWRLLKRHKR